MPDFEELWQKCKLAADGPVYMSHSGYALWLRMANKEVNDALADFPDDAEFLAAKAVLAKLQAGEALTKTDFDMVGWDWPDAWDAPKAQ